MLSTRRVGLLILAASAAAFVAALRPLALRIEAHNLASNFRELHAEVLQSRQIALEGFPPLSLTDATDERGRAALRLRFGETERLIPVQRPPVVSMPTLAGYDEWLKVLAVHEVERAASPAGVRPAPKPAGAQLLVVARRTPEGFDPASWGSVRRTEWVFDFLRLGRDGAIEPFSRRWPRSFTGEKRFLEQAASDARLGELARIEPLGERTVEYFAALHVIPKLSVPKHKFADTAFSPRVLGWTLPVSMLSLLTGVAGLVLWSRPRAIWGQAPGMARGGRVPA